jgi:putative transposase
MQRDVPFQDGEIYHVYNRGTNKMEIFNSESDYQRFVQLMYVCNQSQTVQLSVLSRSERKMGKLFQGERGSPLVSVLAYCLMPNHFHIILRQEVEGGISEFMRKIATGYSMYFNKSSQRTGTLFQGRFKSKHISDTWYLNHIFSYVHLNPVELKFPRWKDNISSTKKGIFPFLSKYMYSSYIDYFVKERNERSVLKVDASMSWNEHIHSPEQMLLFYEDRAQDTV